MIEREAIVNEAREWVGTPFHHQQRMKGVACDCVGFVAGVAIAVGALPADPMQLPGISEYAGYSARPDGRLRPALDRYLVRVSQEDMRAGDVLCLRWGMEPQHLGIVAQDERGRQTIIHAENRRNGKVVEHRLCFTDNAMRFVAAYRFPGVSA